MLRFAIVALVTLGLVLMTALGLSSASATVSNPEFYAWNFASVGSSELVCKKTLVVPRDLIIPSSSMQAVSINSAIVDDKFCANSTKPVN
ncbi:MAG: hypothetical protein JGK24_25085 [Microcoleus sp. PH2017_29_MFU_D_A]|jgi:hypothetical protein|uniref:hypothetical protein n=1 Tax=unclassified Microcoleus TaxID=2642155 RepID=UPI001D8F049F|nr:MULTISPECIES: hypothetical protein [unclassified Microcoleus]MCC3418111.1 hypothetical protein [Microcoleus sp. PH2017_07_MST_O_A]MCC3431620.1 hypothetical protein [Microcoleus sp. PH2017_04_SCI_O_A]MCC3442342.1 hypothetical protein [Microcoleus sp. PH2017_03_ELD_O_A]MCC3467709.1 hypothetical protein [Microcoleus sp. PH2017_06_SFM_O_A]MCC3506018.1 hypothetical protein [Microcoleus sp. PH2017_19_SFW_U_A]MCC3513256.1 hypothetical protein [Microcoleus sp. PH2017_17_BER_D_A]TAE08576.1 MAG: hy